MARSTVLMMLGTLLVSAAAWGKTYDNYYYNWTGAAGNGILNDEANWQEEVLVTTSDIKPTYRFPYLGTVGEKVTLTEDFAVPNLVFTNAPGQALLTIDLAGHAMALGTENYQSVTFANQSPLMLSNGVFKVSNTYFYSNWGVPDAGAVDVRFVDISASYTVARDSTYVRHIGPQKLLFKDSVLTNFPGNVGIGSNSEVLFDNCQYYKNGEYYRLRAGTTNATVRFSNGSVVTRGATTVAIVHGANVCGNRIIFDSGSTCTFFGKSGTSNPTLNGTNNVIAVSNACVKGLVSLTGVSNRVIFSESDYSGPLVFDGTSIDFWGEGNEVAFSGRGEKFTFTSLNVTGQARNPVVRLEDNSSLSNAFTIYATRSSGLKVLLGTNSILKTSELRMYDNSNKSSNSTNALFRVGQDALFSIGSASQSYGFYGEGTRLVLDNGAYEFRNSNGYSRHYAGTSIELNGDKAWYKTASYFKFGLADFEKPDLHGTILFRPGPTGYGGTAPIRIGMLRLSTMAANTVFKFDLRDYLRDSRVRHHRIPLMNGNPTSWDSSARPDLARLTEALEITPKGRTKNEQIIYDSVQNAVCLDFDQVLGLMIIVR